MGNSIQVDHKSVYKVSEIGKALMTSVLLAITNYRYAYISYLVQWIAVLTERLNTKHFFASYTH